MMVLTGPTWQNGCEVKQSKIVGAGWGGNPASVCVTRDSF